MMEEDLEERLLGVRGMSAMENDTGSGRGLHRYDAEQRNGDTNSVGNVPQLRDLRKKKPSNEPSGRRSTSTSSGDESALSPRRQPEVAPEDIAAPNPFDDVPIEQVKPQSPAPTPSTESRPTIDEVDDEPIEEKKQRLEAQRHDEEALARVQQRMERLWRLEDDNSALARRYARLEEANKKTGAERDEWQRKHAQQVEENEKLAKTLKDREDKCALLEREKQESEKANQKLNKRLDDERERYALLSSQFNELNAKMVEIINNVTNLKLDEIEQEKEARRQGVPLPKKKPPPPAPIAQSAAAYFGFASPSKPATPTKPKAALTPSKPRE
jgi:hypothetical protein